MSATLAQLLTAPTVEQVFQTLIGYYQAAGFPVQSWQAGGVERTRLMAIATGICDYGANFIPGITAGGFLDYAPGTGWMPLLAQELYSLPQNLATFTQGTITLTNTSGSPYTITAGKLISVFGASGNRYINTTGGTLAASGGTLSVTFQAENPGAKYNDPSSSGAITLVNPLPGVTLTNVAGAFSSVAHVGAGTGTLGLTGSSGVHLWVITINSTGASGTATWSVSIDGGAAVSHGNAASATISGVTITLTNGGAGTSFVENDTYTFTTPGSWITQQGSDTEPDTTLAGRCRNRWPSLSGVATAGYYQLLAQSTPGVGSQVVQCLTQTDPNVNNKINLVVAGPAGPLPGGTISTINTYVQPRVAEGDYVVIVSPSTLTITIIATITVFASQYTAASNAITTALDNYVASIPINGTLRIAAIIDAIMNVSGVIDCSGVTINGSASNLTLGGTGVFVMPAYPPTLTLSWITQ